jgi:hypothetical protein
VVDRGDDEAHEQKDLNDLVDGHWRSCGRTVALVERQ